MRKVTGRSLLLLLAFSLFAPPVFADDKDIMGGGGLVDTKAPVQQGVQGTQKGVPAQGLPAQGQKGPDAGGTQKGPDVVTPANNNQQYETDMRETVSELQDEVYKLREEMDQLKALREKDQKAFDARVAEINRQLDQRGVQASSGMSGRVNEIDRGIQEVPTRDALGRAPNDPNYGRDAYGRAPSDPNFGRAPNQTTPTTNNGQQQSPDKMNFFQKLLLAILDGVGKGLAKVADRKFNQVQANANAATNRMNSRYPDRSAETQTRVNQAIDEAWRTGRVSRAPVNAPIYNSQGQDVRVVARGNNGDVVSVNGNLTLLPRVTDDAGTHPMINLPLGVGD